MTARVAAFSFDEPFHRRTLIRIIDPANPRRLGVAMQNPSSAESEAIGRNDPTVRRLIDFTAYLGFGRLDVFNPHTRRASQPANLYHWYHNETTLAERDAYKHDALWLAMGICRDVIASGGVIVAASGNCYFEDSWIRRFWRLIANYGFPLHAFGVTASGAPIHPMARGKHRLPDAVTLQMWTPR